MTDAARVLPGAEDADEGVVGGADVVRKGPAGVSRAGLWW